MDAHKMTARQLRIRLMVMAGLMVVLPAILAPVSILALDSMLQAKLAQPEEEKLQQMEQTCFKDKGICTVEQYDAYWTAGFGRRPAPRDRALFYTPLLMLGVLLAGAWFFKRWALLGGIAFAGARIAIDTAYFILASPSAAPPVMYILLLVFNGYLMCLLLQMLDAVFPIPRHKFKFFKHPEPAPAQAAAGRPEIPADPPC